MDVWTIISIAVALFLTWAFVEVVRKSFTMETVFEYQCGLRYENGKLIDTLGPGRYSTLWPGTVIHVEDMREQLLVIGGQEMLTSDNLAVKVSLAIRHKTTDAKLKSTSAQDVEALIYSEAQIALRRSVAARPLESVLADRNDLADELVAALVAEAIARGVEILGVDVRDVMLSGETKRAYADIFRAKKDGEAALERAVRNGGA